MDAIRVGDDRAARAALVEMLPHAEDAAPLEADLTVLRAMADECGGGSRPRDGQG